MDDKTVFITFEKKGSEKAGSVVRRDRDVFSSSKPGMENNRIKTACF